MLKYLPVCIFLGSVMVMAQQPLNPAELGVGPLTRDAAANNALEYGVDVSSAFDDNAVIAAGPTTGRQTNTTASVQPRMRLLLDRTRWSSDLYYGPSFTYSNNIDSYNNHSQAVGLNIQYHCTRRLSAHFRNAFSYTSNPLEAVRISDQLPGLGIVNGPNSSVLGANVRSTTEEFQGDLIYLLGPHTVVGGGGTLANLKYQPTTATLLQSLSQESRSWSGNVFYSHQLTRMYAVAIQYSAQNTTSEIHAGRFDSLSHQVLGFFTVSFRPGVNLSVFGGPVFSNLTDDIVFPAPISSSATKSSFAAGSALSWQGEHSGLRLSFVQRLADGGLGGGAVVRTETVSLEGQRRLSRRSAVSLISNYVSNNQYDPLSTVRLADSAIAGISFSRTLTPRFGLNCSVMRQQFMGSAPVGLLQRSHDIASVSLSYSMRRPIGR